MGFPLLKILVLRNLYCVVSSEAVASETQSVHLLLAAWQGVGGFAGTSAFALAGEEVFAALFLLIVEPWVSDVLLG